jgi:chromosome segregation ATPase
MGALWEIVQSGLMYGHYRKTTSDEERLAQVEQQLAALQETLKKLVVKIEELHGLDVDGDGKVGNP